MKYRVTIGDRELLLDLDEVDGDRRLAVEGAPLSADIVTLGEPSTFNVLIGGRSYTAAVRPHGEGYAVALAGRVYEMVVEDERTRALTKLVAAHHDDGELIVKAPMPGLVLKVLVETGQAVDKGTHLAVLEAMKMENDIATPRAGTVKQIKVTPGQKVNQGEVLMVIA